MTSPEDQARQNIDQMLTKSGWAVRDQGDTHVSAYRGIALRNFTLKREHGFADYLLYVDGREAGVVEAKKEGIRSPELKSSRTSTPRGSRTDCPPGINRFLFPTNPPVSKPALPTASTLVAKDRVLAHNPVGYSTWQTAISSGSGAPTGASPTPRNR